MDFELRQVPLLSRSGANRDGPERADPEAAAAGWARAVVLRVNSANQVLVANRRVVLIDATAWGDRPPADAVMLGRIGNGRQVWAIRAPLDSDGTPDARALDLRGFGPAFDDLSTQLVSTATALLNWHDQARFSAVDGTETTPARCGWARVNPVTGAEEFPRIDPAIICLVHDGGDRALLARQASWPRPRFSLLAGFVEAGESLEACVAREIREEVGLTVRDVRYLGSQPWPFPRSLMLGFHAVADPEQPVVFNDGEIADAAWFTRDEIRAALAAGDWTGDDEDADTKLLLPGVVSIARVIIESWVAAE